MNLVAFCLAVHLEETSLVFGWKGLNWCYCQLLRAVLHRDAFVGGSDYIERLKELSLWLPLSTIGDGDVAWSHV